MGNQEKNRKALATRERRSASIEGEEIREERVATKSPRVEGRHEVQPCRGKAQTTQNFLSRRSKTTLWEGCRGGKIQREMSQGEKTKELLKTSGEEKRRESREHEVKIFCTCGAKERSRVGKRGKLKLQKKCLSRDRRIRALEVGRLFNQD